MLSVIVVRQDNMTMKKRKTANNIGIAKVKVSSPQKLLELIKVRFSELTFMQKIATFTKPRKIVTHAIIICSTTKNK